jgi:hypothetical protein
VSNRRLARTYTLQAEFDGEGVLVADPYPLYPRAFLWSHLDDGIMEAVTTNWGNEGIYMEGVGPSLIGRASPGLGPLQQIPLGGALQFDANGNLAYDPTDVENQIATLTNQLTTLQQQFATLTTQQQQQFATLTTLQQQFATLTNQLTTLQQQFATLNTQVQLLYATLKSSALNPYGQAGLAGAGALAAALVTPYSLALPTLSGSGNLQALIGFQLPMAPRSFSAVGGVAADVFNFRGIQATMIGAGAAHVDLTQVASSVKQLGSQLFAGAGGGTSRLGLRLAAPATLAGAGNLSISLPIALGGSASLAGAGTSAARLIQTQRILQTTLVGAGGVNANPFVQSSTWDPVNTTNATLTNGNKTATATANFAGALGTKSRNSGQLYFEVTLNVLSTTSPNAGLSTTGYSVGGDLGAGTAAFGVMIKSGQYAEMLLGTNYGGGPTAPRAGDVLGFAVDLTNQNVWVHLNGTWFHSTGGTGSADFQAVYSAGTSLWPTCTLDVTGGTGQCTINTGPTFAYTPPSGFLAWG